MTSRFLFPGLLLLLLCHPSPLCAWGCKGHQIVALIAENHLRPETGKFLEALLEENPTAPGAARACADPELGPLAAASTWADDIRAGRPETAPWHYINIPRAAGRDSLEQFCGTSGCITQAIARQWALLKDPGAPRARRAEALRFLVHLVADLHMPLHASDNNDLGGNCVPLTYFDRAPVERARFYSPNLHELWDRLLLETDMAGTGVRRYAQTLDAAPEPDRAGQPAAVDSVEAWAWESHELANSAAYSGLGAPIPVETPVPVRNCTDDSAVGERMLALHLSARDIYQSAAALVIRARLALAGLRLAMILNDAATPPRADESLPDARLCPRGTRRDVRHIPRERALAGRSLAGRAVRQIEPFDTATQ